MFVLIDRQERVSFLKRAFERVKQSADGVNVACMCPNAECDSVAKRKLKLAVRLDDGKFHCWVCGVKGSKISSLVRRYRRDLIDEAEKLWPPSKHHKRIRDIIIVAQEAVQLPVGFKLMAANLDTSAPELKAVIRYVRRRGLTVDDMWRRRLGFSVDPEFANRVIVPSFDRSGRLNYYTSRAIYDSMWPKYTNAEGRKQSIVYNEIDIDWDNELVLTEGPFDVFTTVGNTTCIFGNSLDEKFLLFHRIIEHNTPVVLALDRKERAKTKRIARLLYGFDIDVRVLSIDGYADLGEMPREVYVDRLKDAKRWTPTNALVERISAIDVMRGPSISGSLA